MDGSRIIVCLFGNNIRVCAGTLLGKKGIFGMDGHAGLVILSGYKCLIHDDANQFLGVILVFSKAVGDILAITPGSKILLRNKSYHNYESA